MLTFILALLAADPRISACAEPPQKAVRVLEREAKRLYATKDPVEAAKAAELWLRAADLYPVCGKTIRQRLDHRIRAHNALKLANKLPNTCEDPELRSSTLLRTSIAELEVVFPASGTAPPREIKRMREELRTRLDGIPESTRKIADFIDRAAPLGSPEDTLAVHAEASAKYGDCPMFRAALARGVLASPEALPPPPSCDEQTAAARGLVREAMTAMTRVDAEANQTQEYAALQGRLSTLDGEGEEVFAARSRLAAAENDDDRGETWAVVARELPVCSPYLVTKHDAALEAVTAWRRASGYVHVSIDRHQRAVKLLDDVLADLEEVYGERAPTLPEHVSLTRAKSSLKPPPRAEPAARVAKKPDPSPPPPPRIYRFRPERNMLELGLLAGIGFPASETHQLFDPYRQRDSPGSNSFWRPYRPVNPAFGLRFAWYPLSFLGGELEGGIMPSKILVAGEPTDRATLFNFRAHLIGQLPLWRVAPFILVGGGLIGTSGALGKDVDPSLNLGGGIKVYITRRFMMRLDIREVRAARLGIDAGGTDYPEINLGLSLTLNRAKTSNKPGTRSKGG